MNKFYIVPLHNGQDYLKNDKERERENFFGLQMVVYAMLQTEGRFFNKFCERKLDIYCKNTRMLKLYQNVLYINLLHYRLRIIVMLIVIIHIVLYNQKKT